MGLKDIIKKVVSIKVETNGGEFTVNQKENKDIDFNLLIKNESLGKEIQFTEEELDFSKYKELLKSNQDIICKEDQDPFKK